MLTRLTALAFLLFAASPSLAQTEVEETYTATDAAPSQLVFSLRGGFNYDPVYFGSDEYSATVTGGLRLHYLSFGDGWKFGNPDPWFENIGFRPSLTTRFIGQRSADDYSELDGLDDVDWAIEFGGRLEYAQPNFFAYGSVRRGFGGHEGWVGEAGADYVWRPSTKWRFAVGPRFYWGDDEFVDTYFGVTEDEAAKSSFSSFDADSGLVTAGLRIGALYRINDDWALSSSLFYDSYQEGVSDSPIIKEGAADQWRARFEVVRAFRTSF